MSDFVRELYKIFTSVNKLIDCDILILAFNIYASKSQCHLYLPQRIFITKFELLFLRYKPRPVRQTDTRMDGILGWQYTRNASVMGTDIINL